MVDLKHTQYILSVVLKKNEYVVILVTSKDLQLKITLQLHRNDVNFTNLFVFNQVSYRPSHLPFMLIEYNVHATMRVKIANGIQTRYFLK